MSKGGNKMKPLKIDAIKTHIGPIKKPKIITNTTKIAAPETKNAGAYSRYTENQYKPPGFSNFVGYSPFPTYKFGR